MMDLYEAIKNYVEISIHLSSQEEVLPSGMKNFEENDEKLKMICNSIKPTSSERGLNEVY